MTQRYKNRMTPDGDWLTKADDGDWMLYTDHAAEVARLRAALADAIDEVECWAGYASDYFREKHDYAGGIAKLRAALGKGEA